MKAILGILVVGLMVSGFGEGKAQAHSEDERKRSVAISESLKRLSCYDELGKQLGTAEKGLTMEGRFQSTCRDLNSAGCVIKANKLLDRKLYTVKKINYLCSGPHKKYFQNVLIISCHITCY